MIESFFENFKFSKIGFAKITPEIEIKKDLFEKLSFKNKKDLLIKDRKDAGALKVKKEYLQKNYKLYANLLLKNGYVKIAEELVEDNIYPYVVMHILNEKKLRNLYGIETNIFTVEIL